MLTQMQNAGLTTGRREHRDDRRRASQTGNIAPPSPAVVRHNSKRKTPAALAPGSNTPGQVTPHSAAAQVNVPVGTPQQRTSGHHPYASGGYDYNADDGYAQQQQYERASPMVSSVAAPALSNVRATAGAAGVSRDDGQDMDEPPSKNTLLRILTCRCG